MDGDDDDEIKETAQFGSGLKKSSRRKKNGLIRDSAGDQMDSALGLDIQASSAVMLNDDQESFASFEEIDLREEAGKDSKGQERR